MFSVLFFSSYFEGCYSYFYFYNPLIYCLNSRNVDIIMYIIVKFCGFVRLSVGCVD